MNGLNGHIGLIVDNKCDGCYGRCTFSDLNADGSCPCSICILKMTCTGDDESVCDEWEEWFDNKE